MDTDFLVLRNVSGGAGRIPILFDISLTVARGDFVGLHGNNGMGKTTLLKAIAGHLGDVTGEFIFEGRSIAGERADQRARAGIGYVPQGRQIFPELTALENLNHRGNKLIRRRLKTQLTSTAIITQSKIRGRGHTRINRLIRQRLKHVTAITDKNAIRLRY